MIQTAQNTKTQKKLCKFILADYEMLNLNGAIQLLN